MSKILIIFSIFSLVVLFNCSSETTPVYWDRAMVEISLIQTGRIDFFVPDQGDSGWNYYDPGADTIIIEFAVKNLSDAELSLAGISWSLHTGDRWIAFGIDENVPPVIFLANDSTTMHAAVVIYEGTANAVDSSDGLADFSGTGTFKFGMNGYDNERYEDIRSNYLYVEMSVAKP